VERSLGEVGRSEVGVKGRKAEVAVGGVVSVVGTGVSVEERSEDSGDMAKQFGTRPAARGQGVSWR
jgi:hypothetical protein